MKNLWICIFAAIAFSGSIGAANAVWQNLTLAIVAQFGKDNISFVTVDVATLGTAL